jgi:hypothetical protein
VRKNGTTIFSRNKNVVEVHRLNNSGFNKKKKYYKRAILTSSMTLTSMRGRKQTRKEMKMANII